MSNDFCYIPYSQYLVFIMIYLVLDVLIITPIGGCQIPVHLGYAEKSHLVWCWQAVGQTDRQEIRCHAARWKLGRTWSRWYSHSQHSQLVHSMAYGIAIGNRRINRLGWQESITAYAEQMNPEFKAFMHLRRPPVRLRGEQVAWRWGMSRDEVRIVSSPDIIGRVREALPPKERNLVLSSATALRPLGNPAVMATKYFWEPEIARLEQDVEWLNKAVRTIREYWRQKKARKGSSGIYDNEMIS